MKPIRDYSKKGYVYYKLCKDCGKRINKDSILCKRCARIGKRNPKYKGGFISRGYKIISINSIRVYEHRHIWETHHKRKIPKGYSIHHKDTNKLNNHIKNLILVKKNMHRLKYHRKARKGMLRTCSDCGKTKKLTTNFPKRRESRTGNKRLISGYRGRCKKCWRKYQAEKMKRWRNRTE